MMVRDHLGDPGADGRIILRWIFRKWDTVIPRLTKIIRSGITFVSRNVISPRRFLQKIV